MAASKDKGSISESAVRRIGEELLGEARKTEQKIAETHPWETKLLDWCVSNDELKTQIFRFIDVFPALRTGGETAAHIREYFPSRGMRLPREIRTGLALTKAGFLTAPLIKKSSEWLHGRMAKFFIGAGSIEEALEVVTALESRGMMTSIDLLGERTLSERDAEAYAKAYRKLFALLGERKKGPRFQNVSLKLTALDPEFEPVDAEETSARVRARLIPLLTEAKARDVFVYIDMEHFAVRDLTLRIMRDVLAERAELTTHVGIVLQAYLKDAEETAREVIRWAATLTHPLAIRLVRGAYWDTEIMHAAALGWPVPVFQDKAETDAAYERLTDLFLRQHPRIRLAVATHNVRSIAYAMAWCQAHNRPPEEIEFQLLYGLGAPLEPAVRSMRYPLRLYMPVGDPLPGMSYLVRRLLENVSQQSFLRKSFSDTSSAVRLLAPPEIKRPAAGREGESADHGSKRSFSNEPVLDFSRAAVRRTFQEAVTQARAAGKASVPLWIDGEEIHLRQTALSINPAWSSEVVAEYSSASRDHARLAIASAERALGPWSHTTAEERARLLRRTAGILRRKRYALAAIEIMEVGKPWREADADVVEAIDFLNFYADEALRRGRDRPTEALALESNVLRSRARGITAVIAPWNFPLAILTGMSGAALAAGNPVILKPAEQSPLTAWQLASAFREAGLPRGAVQFLSGSGPELGPVLVEDPRVAVIAFTGSRRVGLDIISRAASANAGSGQIKKVITELGGKNAVIVDATADFDQAVPAVLESAFGYAGQKCSAASRLIVVASAAEAFLKRLVESAPSLSVGDPALARTRVGPLIDGDASTRLRQAYTDAEATGRILYRGELGGLSDQGYFEPPTIVGRLPHDSPLLSRELFGPFLAVSVVKDFTEALEAANASPYALTGGLFSRTPSHIERAKACFDVGNLYINRKITGALVRRQPFGGFRQSGGGSKAGGEDYLREFFCVRTLTENRMRHGFAPED